MTSWDSDIPALDRTVPARGWVWIVLRGLPMLIVLCVMFVTLLVVRLLERPIFGMARPITPWITQGFCQIACAFLGLRIKIKGAPMRERGAFVCNHASWLDIFVLNAAKRLYFVAKSEVSGWPGIGLLARGTGTVFVQRKRTEAKTQAALFDQRLTAGHKLLFFPEGTSTDGQQVLDFKTTLFAAFFTDHLKSFLHIQPITLIYHAPQGADPRHYGWWGDMGFGPSLLWVLATRPQGWVELIYHTPLAVADFADRKSLAKACEAVVRDGLTQRLDQRQ
jgi:1-acyl-sn-glycerol-3-phosphate acyltransferase